MGKTLSGLFGAGHNNTDYFCGTIFIATLTLYVVDVVSTIVNPGIFKQLNFINGCILPLAGIFSGDGSVLRQFPERCRFECYE